MHIYIWFYKSVQILFEHEQNDSNLPGIRHEPVQSHAFITQRSGFNMKNYTKLCQGLRFYKFKSLGPTKKSLIFRKIYIFCLIFFFPDLWHESHISKKNKKKNDSFSSDRRKKPVTITGLQFILQGMKNYFLSHLPKGK